MDPGSPDEQIAIDVWYVAPGGLEEHALAACDAVITDEERAAVRRFVSQENQRERLVARALVRNVLSRYRDVAPASWQFRAGRWGKPEIDPPSGLRFNLAHHPTMVVCVVAEDRDVGIDVEPLSRNQLVLGVADSVFAPSEIADLGALADAARADRAVSLWTLKEAYIKARGMGLSLPVREVAFHFDERGPHLVTIPSVDRDAGRWALETTDMDGHRIAVAADTRGSPVRLDLRPWRP